ncbi:NADPH-dependent FMN reductase [Pararhodobacter zhoushanensis]|uniref:NADPH-dependent FMN reductase n=1 Tax=Pararhodobacter zhoushanensis TaxID=2479545 RepID=UPI000F8F3E48|nr:NAD(P)H-dependent oxidoreductase [Pararhodobacter zhoushanensis]
MTSKPRIGVIISSTRDSRFADKPAQWILEKAKAKDWDVELVDIKDFDLPFFNEPASNAWMPSSDPAAIKWQEKIATFDGFIFVLAEYNHSITGALKNALDQAYVEWNRKAFGVVGYGGVGAARAAEHLRTIGVELQMASTRSGVYIGGGDFIAIHPLGQQNKPMSEIEGSIGPSAGAMLDELDWWTRATMAARG